MIRRSCSALLFSSVWIIFLLFPASGTAQNRRYLFYENRLVLPGSRHLEEGKFSDSVRTRYLMSAIAYRYGEYGIAGFLATDAAQSHLSAKADTDRAWSLIASNLRKHAIHSWSMEEGGHAAQLMKIFPFPIQSGQEEPGPKEYLDGRPFYPGVDDGVCGKAKRAFDLSDWLGRGSIVQFGVRHGYGFEEASILYRNGRYLDAAQSFLRPIHTISVEEADVLQRNEKYVSPMLFCAAQAYHRSGEPQKGVAEFCKILRSEMYESDPDYLVWIIKVLSGNEGLPVRDICLSVSGAVTGVGLPRGLQGQSEPSSTSPTAYMAHWAAFQILKTLYSAGEYESAGVAFLSMGNNVLLSVLPRGKNVLMTEGNPWQEVGIRDNCIGGPYSCESFAEMVARRWIEDAARSFFLVGGVEHSRRRFMVLSQDNPYLLEFIGPEFFGAQYASRMDYHRSLLRAGLDVEALSISKYPPVLYGNSPDLKSDWLPQDFDSKQVEGLFARAKAKYDDKNFVEAADDFFGAALGLDMKCDTDLCRDGVWVWRAHAVWNAVTSLRQIEDPAKACEEAKKFVALAGDGHQKSNAADVEDALCGNASEKPGQE